MEKDEKVVKQNNNMEINAVGVVEVILILVVLIALVVIFRDELTTLVTNIFGSISEKAESIYG